jgi:hypothetical protein
MTFDGEFDDKDLDNPSLAALPNIAEEEAPVESAQVLELLAATYMCHLIEFNPFYGDNWTGSALFEWQRDFELLYHYKGTTPFLTTSYSFQGERPVIRVRKYPSACHIAHQVVVVDYV